MRKKYQKPLIDVVEFELSDNIMDGSGDSGTIGGGGIISGVEDGWFIE